MRHHEIITERTLENLSIIDDCVQAILDCLPYRFPANDTLNYPGSDLFRGLEKKYDGTKLQGKIRKLSLIHFRFSTEERSLKSRTMGSYISSPFRMMFFNTKNIRITTTKTSTNTQPTAVKSTLLGCTT